MHIYKKTLIQKAPLWLPLYAALSCCGAIILYHHHLATSTGICTVALVVFAVATVLRGWPQARAEGATRNLQFDPPIREPRSVVAILLRALSCGLIWAALYGALRADTYTGGGMPLESINSLQGTMLAESRAQGVGGRYLIAIGRLGSDQTEVALSKKVLCYSLEWHPIQAGQSITSTVQFQIPTTSLVPPRESTATPQCKLSHIALVYPDAPVHTSRPSTLRNSVRAALTAPLNKFPKPTAQLLKALLLGERGQLSSATRSYFRRAGVTHLLALSGMHLAIIVSLIGALLRPFFNRRVTIALLAVCTVLYLWLIGSNPSLERATIMFVLWSLLKLSGRETNALNIIALAFLLLVVLHPRAVTEISFQLSFAALSGILFLTPLIVPLVSAYLPRWLARALSASVAAQLFTLPLVLIYFDTLHPIGIVATVVLSPLVTVYMWQAVLWLPLVALGIPYITEAGTTFSFMLFEAIRYTALWLSQVPALAL